MSLKSKGDFLVHGVVLQIRVFRPAARRKDSGHSGDVSRETVFAAAVRRAMFHVKHFCVRVG